MKPLVRLSNERNGLMMFEAGMAMTNLASLNDEIRCVWESWDGEITAPHCQSP